MEMSKIEGNFKQFVEIFYIRLNFVEIFEKSLQNKKSLQNSDF